MRILLKNAIVFMVIPIIVFISACRKQHSDPRLIPFISGIRYPVCIAHAGDSRIFIVCQDGYIYESDSSGKLNPEPFLDIRDRVTYGGERGLLGMAFHPKFKENGFFYLNYVGDGDISYISRFRVNSGNPHQADASSELKLIRVEQPYQNHNGGNLCFGPDGYLYIGFGDGGSAGDPENRAQNKMDLLGKMLRIDVDHGNPYAIPVSNPFVGKTDARSEIWATGLRNPWRFSFDRLTGDLWIADVGQNKVEEIDFQPAGSRGGENYGWRCYEGNDKFNDQDCTNGSSFIFPIHNYPHGPECSVTGGFVYRGDPSSVYYGHYFFADYCSDKIWTLHKTGEKWVLTSFGQFNGNNFSTFGEDSKGQLYIAGLSSGTIFQLNLNN